MPPEDLEGGSNEDFLEPLANVPKKVGRGLPPIHRYFLLTIPPNFSHRTDGGACDGVEGTLVDEEVVPGLDVVGDHFGMRKC